MYSQLGVMGTSGDSVPEHEPFTELTVVGASHVDMATPWGGETCALGYKGLTVI